MNQILLVEDDEVIAKVILYYLRQSADYRVEWAKTAGEALAAVRRPFDLILLDVCLPDVDGVALCARLRESLYCPIIFISCIDDEETMIHALENGGDDYLTKPFNCKVLHSRIEANLRRVRLDQRRSFRPVLRFAGFSVNEGEHTILRDGQTFHIAPIEFSLLMYFLSHPHRTISLDELYEAVWEKPSFGDVRTVIAHIYNLRGVLEQDRNNPRYLRSVRGYGYYFAPEGDAEERIGPAGGGKGEAPEGTGGSAKDS